jgi:hypothetical protein
MPAWKTFDDATAAALKEHLGDANLSVETRSRPLFDGGDSVVVAPTLQKGAALVITTRRKPAPKRVEPARPLDQPAGEELEKLPEEAELSAGQASIGGTALDAPVPQAVEVQESEPDGTAELAFGPTTWERAEGLETSPGVDTPDFARPTASTDPEIWDLPSEAPLPNQLGSDKMSSESENHSWPIAEPALPPERHYVASGFLGLGDYAEDEEELARQKRPWWKRIFTD